MGTHLVPFQGLDHMPDQLHVRRGGGGDHDDRGSGGRVEEQVLGGAGGVVADVFGRGEVDPQREPQPAAGPTAGGHEHEGLAGMEAEQHRYGGHQLTRLADPDRRT
ncbi:hypothetical protein GCM10009608_37330 [Pseudonocardia alaniniphila]